MSFNGTEGAAISQRDATDLTSTYKKKYPGVTKGVFIGREHIEDLLNCEDSMGIRVYFGRTTLGENTIVMVSADSNEDDDLSLIINNGCSCPSVCGCANDLNA